MRRLLASSEEALAEERISIAGGRDRDEITATLHAVASHARAAARARAAANMGKKRRTRDGAKAMDDDAFAGEDAKPTKGPMPRIKPRITKLSRKQKLRKALKQERGERSADRAVVSTSRKTSKADRKANAKALW